MPQQYPLGKTSYLDQLQDNTVDTLTLPKEDRECTICFNNSGTLVLVRLHDSHLVCSPCARRWLANADICPHCRKTLFEPDRYITFRDHPGLDICINDDRGNRGRLRVLHRTSTHGRSTRMRKAAGDRLRSIYRARAWALRKGMHTPRSSEYRVDGMARRPTVENIPDDEVVCLDDEHTVHAAHLIHELQARNTHFADLANTSPHTGKKPGLACHPIAECLTRPIIRTLEIADGYRLTARHLKEVLRKYGFSSSVEFVNRTMDAGLRHVIMRMVMHMIEDVVSMHAGVDVLPRGQAARMSVSVVSGVEMENGEVERVGRFLSR